ncbi:MAG TPA: hypothetical protein VFA90_19150 [Terriglobales bacterium]|nr:hypothetical protein [Terriglobales bacterium]
MQKNAVETIALTFVVLLIFSGAVPHARAQNTSNPDPSNPYPTMAPLSAYLMPQNSEVALARSAAPKSISYGAEVMALGHDGYTTAAKGTNGFLCIVERSWGAATTEKFFWNSKIRAPICFNAAAARTFAPIYLMKTRLVLAAKSKAEIVQATDSAFESKQLPALEPGAMCYMLSKQQYLNDQGKNWHPHLMFFVSGDVGKSWGADLPGSPVISANDPEERVTIFMLWVSKWSDGTPAPMMAK